MHPNPIFRTDQTDADVAFVRDRGFGVLSVNAADGPLIAHVPFILSDDASNAHLHLVRSNPIWRDLDGPQPAVIAVSGGDAYISPDWYGVDDQVPTWNYAAVHLRGMLHPLPQENLRGILDDLSAHFEAALAPKQPWHSNKMKPDVLSRMMRQIVPVKLEITSIHGTWKLSQNKPHDVQRRVVNALEASPIGQNTDHIRAFMAAALQEIET